MSFAALLADHAHRLAEVPALVERGHMLTYSDFHRRVVAAAWHLREAGVRSGSIVALCVRSRISHAVLLLAGIRLGAAICTLDPFQRELERNAILTILAPRLLLVDRDLRSSVAVETVSVIDQWWEFPTGTRLPEPVDDAGLPAVLLLTSGSTGLPKIVPLTQGAAFERASIQREAYGLWSGARHLLGLPAAATAATQGLFAQLLSGSTSYFPSALSSPDELLDLLVRERIERATMVPTSIRWMLERSRPGALLLPDIQVLTAVGAPLFPAEVKTVNQCLTPNLYVGYGSTGAGGVSVARPDQLRVKPSSVGTLVPGATVQIVDEEDRVLPSGSVGRIRVRSRGASTGYFGEAPSGADEIFHEGFVYTGDLGRLDSDGFLYIEGRASTMIIRGGQNLYPAEIERALREHPAVAEVVVAGQPDPILGEVPVAWLVLREKASEAELLATCRSRLSQHKVPVRFHIIESLPLTAAGKVDRQALATTYR